jgi:hypothetical protein
LRLHAGCSGVIDVILAWGGGQRLSRGRFRTKIEVWNDL